VHLSRYNCIQKLHMGLAKHVHLSGLCTYPVYTCPGSGYVQNIGHGEYVHLSGFYCIASRHRGNIVRHISHVAISISIYRIKMSISHSCDRISIVGSDDHLCDQTELLF
jgi:hypothetical protein